MTILLFRRSFAAVLINNLRGKRAGEKKSLAGKEVLTFVAIGIAVAILVGVLFGWEYSIIGHGAGLGPWIGVYFWNKKAREVDKYREELINGQKSKPNQNVPDTTKPPA